MKTLIFIFTLLVVMSPAAAQTPTTPKEKGLRFVSKIDRVYTFIQGDTLIKATCYGTEHFKFDGSDEDKRKYAVGVCSLLYKPGDIIPDMQHAKLDDGSGGFVTYRGDYFDLTTDSIDLFSSDGMQVIHTTFDVKSMVHIGGKR